ncbi:DUF6338 family protein [Alienimonas californiensis]|uniref:DUF6338 family protein n=1 Tax=Alienimonas californiensis TaxID=2527989 RepID=UPI0011A60225|nr:DUF6338 family protein [Alienimonas californiensis]
MQVIYFLLPGFVAAWIFYGFTAHPRQSPFERVVEALIFTAFVQAATVCLQSLLLWAGRRFGSLGMWTEAGGFAVGVLLALPIGALAAAMSNGNAPHGWLPDWITRRTSLPSEWYAGFAKFPRFVYLRLKDGRTFYGWPVEWPDTSDSGHFLMTRCEWILADSTRVELPLIEAMLLPAELVETVEFELPQQQITAPAIRENQVSLREIHDAQHEAGVVSGVEARDDGKSSSTHQETRDGEEAPVPATKSDATDRSIGDERFEPTAPAADHDRREATRLPAPAAEDKSEPIVERGER